MAFVATAEVLLRPAVPVAPAQQPALALEVIAEVEPVPAQPVAEAIVEVEPAPAQPVAEAMRQPVAEAMRQLVVAVSSFPVTQERLFGIEKQLRRSR